jgi:hypothetical protein
MSSFHSWGYRELQQLADDLLLEVPGAVEQSLVFFEAETRGYWHNRARALLARRFKHVQLTPTQQERLLQVILRRLAAGTFTEQFKDQLRLARHLDRDRLVATAHACASSPKDYVRRYAGWVLAVYIDRPFVRD